MPCYANGTDRTYVDKELAVFMQNYNKEHRANYELQKKRILELPAIFQVSLRSTPLRLFHSPRHSLHVLRRRAARSRSPIPLPSRMGRTTLRASRRCRAARMPSATRPSRRRLRAARW